MTSSTLTMTEPGVAAADASRSRIGATVAGLALAVTFVLALSSATEPTLADRITLLGLGIFAALCFWTPLLRRIEAQENAPAFVLTAAMFIVYGLARRAGPAAGPALTFSALPGDRFVISYAAFVVVAAALLTTPFWLRHIGGWTRALLAGIILLAALALFSFVFLGRHYAVGPTEIVDPTPLPHLMMQLVEYGALALLCNIVGTHPPTRRLVLRILPLALLILWAWHQFGAPPRGEEAEEAG